MKETIRTKEEKKNYSVRLKKIEGQIKGIDKMIESDRHCSDVLIQVAAVTKALKSLGQEILANHMKTCMVKDINNNDLSSIDEVMDLFRKLV